MMRFHTSLYFLLTILMSLSRLYAQSSSSHYHEQDLNFNFRGGQISGKLITPIHADGKLPVVVFVHGSGNEDYSSSGHYRHLWEEFTKIGYACYSWNRPGVEGSAGKWYELSVEDRADEVLEAVHQLKTIEAIDTAGIGFWGISQAGWVIPIVAKKFRPAFVITVSAPVTTAFAQEQYRIEAEMKAEGFHDQDISEAKLYNQKLLQLINEAKPYARFAALQEESTDANWSDYVIRGDEMVYAYLRIVFQHDHPPDLTQLTSRLLAIWGENDLVVPPQLSYTVYDTYMNFIGNTSATLSIIPHADHTLTKNASGKRSETIARRKQFKDNPEEIFAPGYITAMTVWLKMNKK